MDFAASPPLRAAKGEALLAQLAPLAAAVEAAPVADAGEGAVIYVTATPKDGSDGPGGKGCGWLWCMALQGLRLIMAWSIRYVYAMLGREACVSVICWSNQDLTGCGCDLCCAK